jgi:glycosyl hydrolase family 123
VQLPGAKLTALDAYHCATDCLAPWRDLAARYPIVASRFVDYICDEPSTAEDWNDCNATASGAESIWPGVRKLVTTSAQRAPSWATDLSPNVSDIDRDGQAAYRGYRSRRSRDSRNPKRSLWPYTSCASFSCGEYESSEYEGWPGYVIDEPSSQVRAMGWLSFLTGATGELYWSTSRSIATAWTNQYLEGGNGDGNLFYPGTPDIIGGTHPIPVESMRLKRIRDGREDYEYLRILAARDNRAAATKVVRSLFGPPSVAMQSATVGSKALNKARSELAATIGGQGSG